MSSRTLVVLLVLSLPSIAFWIAAMVSVARTPAEDWDSPGRKVIAFAVVFCAGGNVGIFIPIGALVWWFDWRTKEKWGHFPGRARWVARSSEPVLPSTVPFPVPVGGPGAVLPPPPSPPASWGPPFPARDVGGPATARQRATAVLAHLGLPFCLAVLPGLLYLEAKRGSFVRAHARQALAYQLGVLVVYVGAFLPMMWNPRAYEVSLQVLLIATVANIPQVVRAGRGRAPFTIWRPEADGWTPPVGPLSG